MPLVHTMLDGEVHVTLSAGEQTLLLEQSKDIEVSTVRPLERVSIDKVPVVFVGFGVTAPERHWDDFGDMDLNGKLAIFLVNDPDFGAGPDEVVAGRFGNRRVTYYGARGAQLG